MPSDHASRPEPLQTAEDLACGLHRLAMSEIAYAFEQLDGSAADPQSAIHECRKAVKRLRALARLAKHRNHRAFRRIDELLQRTGKALAGHRDAAVAVATATSLQPDDASEDVVAALRDGLKVDTDEKASVARAGKTLLKVRKRFDSLVATGDAWEHADLVAGMRAQYRRFRRDARRYLDTYSPEDAHQFRKSLQRHLAQLRVLDAEQFGGFHERIDSLNELSQLLGAHHDLAMLRDLLRRVKKRVPRSTRKLLRRAARSRQNELDTQIIARVPALIEPSPKRLVSASSGSIPDPVTETQTETFPEPRVVIGGN